MWSPIRLLLHKMKIPTKNSRKFLYTSVLSRSFSITGPVYNKNCLNSVAFHRSISLTALGLCANSIGTFFLAPTNLSVSTVAWNPDSLQVRGPVEATSGEAASWHQGTQGACNQGGIQRPYPGKFSSRGEVPWWCSGSSLGHDCPDVWPFHNKKCLKGPMTCCFLDAFI